MGLIPWKKPKNKPLLDSYHLPDKAFAKALYGLNVVDPAQYKDAFERQIRALYCAQYKWAGKDMPLGLTSARLEQLGYVKGHLCAVNYNGELHFGTIIHKNLSFYDTSLVFDVITPLGVVVGRNCVDGINAVIFNTSSDMLTTTSNSPMTYVDQFCDDISSVAARLKIAVLTTTNKLILNAQDELNREHYEGIAQQLMNTDSPFVILNSAIQLTTSSQALVVDFATYFDTIKNYQAIVMAMLGMQAGGLGNEKKERLLSGEIENNNASVDTIQEYNFWLRQEFCKKVKDVLGFEITCERTMQQKEQEQEEQAKEQANAMQSSDNNSPKQE